MSGGGSVEEVSGAAGQMKSDLFAGLDVIDLNQTVTFTKYQRVVLPADGFVFWVRADQFDPSALVNTATLNRVTPNQPRVISQPAPSFDAQGSLHHTTVNRQNEDESSSTNRMIFTAKEQIDDLNDIAPDAMYLATVGGLRFAFSTRSMWYKQAGLYHYSGDAVYPALASQIIESAHDLQALGTVVSNSLPIWLTLNDLFELYPSYLVPDNIVPPYASVHIDEDSTTPMQSAAWHDETGTRWQLVKDVVKVTTYGIRNDMIMDWLDLVNQYALDNPTVMGIMNSPVPRDAKRGQTEISAIAQKKVITFEVNYYQSRVQNISRQLILNAFLKYIIAPLPHTPRSYFVWSWLTPTP